MKITQEHQRLIESIKSEMECPKDFTCYKSGFENLSRIKDVADGKIVECLEEDSQPCEFGLNFGSSVFCQCKLRNYIANNLHV